MEFLSYLAPVAFIFSLSAIVQAGAHKKEIEHLKNEIEELKQQ